MKIVEREIIIVGGGPSGVATFLAAKKMGLSVALVESKQFPRDKTCGDCFFHVDSLRVLEALSDDASSFKKRMDTLANIEDIGIDLYIGEKTLSNVNLGHVFIKRWELDQLLWTLSTDANKETALFEGWKVDEIKKEEAYYILSASNISKEKRLFKGKYLIAADGANSIVRRTIIPEYHYERNVGSRVYLTSDKKYRSFMKFIDEIKPSYFWVFKLSENEYNTGVYLNCPNAERRNIFELHQQYIAEYFGVTISKNDFKSWIIPGFESFKNGSKENCFLTGDAAGFCDPLFGHGIDTGIISGYLAVKSIHDYLNLGLKYSLDEMYAYNLTNYVGKLLTSSKYAHDKMISTNEYSTFFEEFFNSNNIKI